MNKFINLSQQEKINLYNKCKNIYYTGEQESPLSDFEFDLLEKELGLENKSIIGSFHKKNYTISHPVLMGSISKINVLEELDGIINWKKYDKEIIKYLSKSLSYGNKEWHYNAGVKLDGCSWEIVVDKNGKLISCSSRGDGEYGKNLMDWFQPEWKKNYENKFTDYINKIKNENKYIFLKCIIIRGECLIKKSTFNSKYKNIFAIPRNFVSGVLNQDFKNTSEQIEYRNNLDWISYRYIEQYKDGTNIGLDYINEETLPGHKLMDVFDYTNINSKMIYEKFDIIRKKYDYECDGIVIQPSEQYKLNDFSRVRQEDICALKFLPEVVSTIVDDIKWNVSKNGEYIPTGILKDVILGGKKVNKVSFHNYGYIINNHISSGTEITIKLGGDIVPQVDSIVKSSGTSISLPEDSYVDGVHLMKVMTDEDKDYVSFINSVNVIKPDGIGEKVAETLYHIYGGSSNILYLMVNTEWQSRLDDSKSSQNIIKSLNERKQTLTLPDVIQSLGIRNCGEKNSLWLAKKMSGLEPDEKGIPQEIQDVVYQPYFREDVKYFMQHLNIKSLQEEKTDKTYVILTGSPKECGYNTKGEFLAKHPEFTETTKWDQCQYLITDSLDSTSSKMDKAKKKNIPIRTYLDF